MKYVLYDYRGFTGDAYQITMTNRGKEFIVEFERNDFDNADEAMSWIEKRIDAFSPWWFSRRPTMRRYFRDLCARIYPDPNEKPRTAHIQSIREEFDSENDTRWLEIVADTERRYPGTLPGEIVEELHQRTNRN